MKSYTQDELNTALETLNLVRGDVLLVHSALQNLGLLQGAAPRENCALMFEAISKQIGQEGTIVVPTFTFAFCNGQPYDPAVTPSAAMGVFSEYVRERPDSVRSAHPMQSIAASGKLATWLCENDTESSYSTGGPFERMLISGAKVVLLGATIQSVSMVHYVEEQVGVPYRYWKAFTAPYKQSDGTVEPKTYKMYVRDLQQDCKLKLNRIGVLLNDLGAITRTKLGMGKLQIFEANTFVDVTTSQLKKNPSFLVEESPDNGHGQAGA